MNLYPNRHGKTINIMFTFNNTAPWFKHADQYIYIYIYIYICMYIGI